LEVGTSGRSETSEAGKMESTMEAGVETGGGPKAVAGQVVRTDEGRRIREHVDEVVRSAVEETLNALLDAEADHIGGAKKYERTGGRKDTHSGSYDRRSKAYDTEAVVAVGRNLAARS